ncbi:hypothetical protein P152DRAFT_473413 [Eremomyces bilateralis CBS 781.70]|uniref:Zinc finger Mcm10/DnaG-type domain-containing protein n=1 Tax=Eremomyces bilateralis CBS 781.70 TaxID=1392243 RepID=A0A6G1G461_9PEZI|nr:uncharacterized protein P152DRAFT_473413 [Eremomyces bilateralis CBS 781.70]KAF1812877.1 hypothetical protein P152DRAFT_473413 [Eremomyces bilateralis CBS 781.70]
MIVRESNRPKADASPAKWPPKSPFEALQSSPRGRKRIEEARERFNVSPSPSPTKRLPIAQLEADLEDEDDEDEETLQLKLQAIEAKLKLKRLQAARAKKREAASQSSDDRSISRTSSRPSTVTGLHRDPSSISAGSSLVTDSRSTSSRSFVQVPLSPVKKEQTPVEAASPARRLGIDKGLRAEDVSLKRAASSKFGGTIPRSSDKHGISRSRSITGNTASSTQERPKSFSERIAEVRRQEKTKEDREARFERARSQGFGLKQLMDEVGDKEASLRSQSSTLTANSQHERVSTTSGFRDLPTPASSFERGRPEGHAPAAPTPSMTAPGRTQQDNIHANAASESGSSEEISTFDPFTSLHLTKRVTPHATVQRLLTPHSTFTIPQLLATVKGPDFDPPDCPNDSYVVLAVLAKKSTPQDHKKRGGVSVGALANNSTNGHGEGDGEGAGRNKFMVLNLCDLKWEIDLYLFGAAFNKLWKLTPGTVIAILNPDILPPLPHRKDTNAFSLKLAGNEDTVVEIGTSRDLGWCESRKSDGQLCGSWIDKRKTQFCEYHINLQVDKARRGRMEINGMGRTPHFGSSGGGGGGAGRGMFGASKSTFGSGQSRNTGLLPGSKVHDRSTGTTLYMAPGMGSRNSGPPRGGRKKPEENRSVFEDPFIGTLTSYNERGPSREELAKKRKVARDKERALASSLGKLGAGMGSQYLRMREPGAESTDGGEAMVGNGEKEPLDNTGGADAEALGLLGNKASEIRLSPGRGKRKRADGSEPMGWGGAKKSDWLDTSRPKPPSKAKPDSGPRNEEMSPRKRARFLLETKGIRIPGRESLGVPGTNVDDDDDLEIV